eukprot:3601299-Prymnesium_polylepis.1
MKQPQRRSHITVSSARGCTLERLLERKGQAPSARPSARAHLRSGPSWQSSIRSLPRTSAIHDRIVVHWSAWHDISADLSSSPSRPSLSPASKALCRTRIDIARRKISSAPAAPRDAPSPSIAPPCC